MLNLLLKTRQNNYAVNTREWASVAKTCTLATVSVGGCRVYATYILYHANAEVICHCSRVSSL